MAERIAHSPEPETEATRLGDAVRRGESKAGPSRLYVAAVNRADYEHSMIHAGYVLSKVPGSVVGTPFVGCPKCGASLS